MSGISDATIAILATNGFEQSELEVPRDLLRGAGATVHVVTPDGGDIRGWDGSDWGATVAADRALADVDPEDYDALVLPGGQINPDLLRVDAAAVALIRAFARDGRTVAAICHAPWLLIEAGLAEGREMTSYPAIRKDVENAGACVIDREGVVSDGIVTSRNPGELQACTDRIIDEVIEGRSAREEADAENLPV